MDKKRTRVSRASSRDTSLSIAERAHLETIVQARLASHQARLQSYRDSGMTGLGPGHPGHPGLKKPRDKQNAASVLGRLFKRSDESVQEELPRNI